jgi:hypothetical protein
LIVLQRVTKKDCSCKREAKWSEKMPPSPSSRRSPARETYHRRTNSYGFVLPAKQNDDELMLFSDMQKVERENFLLEPSDDFDESIGNADKCCPAPTYFYFVTYHFCLCMHQQN